MIKKIVFLATMFVALVSCNRPEPNYEGVLMVDYGRNGIESFSVVSGAQGPLGPGSELYQVPMFEQKGKEVSKVKISAKDAGEFTMDPAYTYEATRGKGPNIILNYKHLSAGDDEFFNNIEHNVLNKLVYDTFREEARNYTTDSLMNNLGAFERNTESKLKKKFAVKFFTLNTLTSGLEPPRSMANAIESRNNAIQQANQVKNELETSKMYLEKAKIDAETNRVKASGLDSKILQQQWIEALRYSKNRIIITDGKSPLLIQ